MEWIRYNLRGSGWVGPARKGPGVLVLGADRTIRRLATDGLHASDETTQRNVPAIEPFAIAPYGRKRRLSWPLGSITIPAYSELAAWDGHRAAIADEHALTLVSAESDRVVRLSLPKLERRRWNSYQVAASDGQLWIGAEGLDVYALPLAELAELADGKAREVAIFVRTRYVLRQPEARLACVYCWRLQSGMTMVEIGNGGGGVHEPKLVIDLPAWPLAKYSPLVLADQLSPGSWARAEVPGYPPHALVDPDAVEGVRGTVRVSRAEHPEGEDRPVVARADVADRARIDELVATIGREPDVDGHRDVLVDLLLALEDPGAPVYAALRAGTEVSAAKIKAALGPLARFLVDVEFQGGLPVRATLSRSAPRDASSLEPVLADYRLGLFTELRQGQGPKEVYARLVAAPRATALRRIDGTHPTTLKALIAAGRDQIARVDHLSLGMPRRMAPLADKTFDRATTLHAVWSDHYNGDHLVEAIGSLKAFKRVPRTLVLEEAEGRDDHLRRLLEPALERLEVAALVIGGVTLRR